MIDRCWVGHNDNKNTTALEGQQPTWWTPTDAWNNSGMAAKRRTRVARGDAITLVNVPAPVQRRSRARAPVRRRRRRRSAGGRGPGTTSDKSFKDKLIGTAMGGLGYGLIEKHWGAQIPSLPFVGKSGTVAIACYFFSSKHPLVKDVGIAAAAIAGYSYGKEGKVAGYDDDDLAQ